MSEYNNELLSEKIIKGGIIIASISTFGTYIFPEVTTEIYDIISSNSVNEHISIFTKNLSFAIKNTAGNLNSVQEFLVYGSTTFFPIMTLSLILSTPIKIKEKLTKGLCEILEKDNSKTL